MGFVGGQGVIPGQRLSSLPLQAIITHQLHRVPKQGLRQPCLLLPRLVVSLTSLVLGSFFWCVMTGRGRSVCSRCLQKFVQNTSGDNIATRHSNDVRRTRRRVTVPLLRARARTCSVHAPRVVLGVFPLVTLGSVIVSCCVSHLRQYETLVVGMVEIVSSQSFSHDCEFYSPVHNTIRSGS